MGGFYTEKDPVHIFTYLWNIVGTEYDAEPIVSKKTWKMKFDIEGEEEKVEACEDFSDEEEIPAKECEVEVNVRSVQKDEDDNVTMKYVTFQRKSGDGVVYGKFLKNVCARLELFKQAAQK